MKAIANTLVVPYAGCKVRDVEWTGDRFYVVKSVIHAPTKNRWTVTLKDYRVSYEIFLPQIISGRWEIV